MATAKRSASCSELRRDSADVAASSSAAQHRQAAWMLARSVGSMISPDSFSCSLSLIDLNHRSPTQIRTAAQLSQYLRKSRLDYVVGPKIPNTKVICCNSQKRTSAQTRRMGQQGSEGVSIRSSSRNSSSSLFKSNRRGALLNLCLLFLLTALLTIVDK